MLCKFLYDLCKAISSITWRKIPAILHEFSAEESIQYDHHTGHKPKMRYSYRYAGKNYQATRFSYRELDFRSEKEAMNRIYAQSETGHFYARVNPSNPQQSVLLSGPDFYSYCAIVLALLFIYWAAKGISTHNALIAI